MINQSTYDDIQGWAQTRYGPRLTADAGSTPGGASTGGGMLSADDGAPTSAPTSAPASTFDSTWKTATATPTTAIDAPKTQATAGAAPAPAAATATPAPAVQVQAQAPTLINQGDLNHRTIDPATETVNGQLKTMLGENSPLLQQARADAMRSASERGMLNSAMAASGGEEAAIRSAASIATTDSGYYNHAADYNAAADNQATMWNADQIDQTKRTQAGLDSDAAARAQQMTLAQIQDATTRYQAETSDATSRYNTDANYRQQADNNRKTLVNNIVNNMEYSPDRKAAMLEALGEGTSARRLPDGTLVPGTGMAGAVYVIDSVSADLNFGGGEGSGSGAGGSGGNTSYTGDRLAQEQAEELLRQSGG